MERKAQRGGEVVPAARCDDPERDNGPGHGLQDQVDHAVAAYGHECVVPVLGGAPGQQDGVGTVGADQLGHIAA